jgi:uncharacterized protein YdeI (YjbR/CyaY-like superfamily)
VEESMPEQILFKDRDTFRQWLRENHAQSESIWLILGKTNKVKTLSPEEALEEALCFGWIDGLIKSIDETQYKKLFSPRRAKSNWSEKNKKTAEVLIKNGRMTASGMQAIEQAKKNGTWIGKKKRDITQEDIDVFAAAIAANSQATINYQKMSPSVQKQFVGYYLEAKREDTRRQRLEKLIWLLEQNKKPMEEFGLKRR